MTADPRKAGTTAFEMFLKGLLAGVGLGLVTYGVFGPRVSSKGTISPRVIRVVVGYHLLRSIINICLVALMFLFTRDAMTVAGMAAGLLFARNVMIVHYVLRERRSGSNGST